MRTSFRDRLTTHNHVEPARLAQIILIILRRHVTKGGARASKGHETYTRSGGRPDRLRPGHRRLRDGRGDVSRRLPGERRETARMAGGSDDRARQGERVWPAHRGLR